MIGIVRQDETGDVKAYVKENGVGWTVALDPELGRRARLRHPGPTGDLRDLARAA